MNDFVDWIRLLKIQENPWKILKNPERTAIQLWYSPAIEFDNEV